MSSNEGDKCMERDPVRNKLYRTLLRKLPVKGSGFMYAAATLGRRGNYFLFKKCVDMVKNKNCNETKACISSEFGSESPRWEENLYGIPRIALHGIDSICVVLRKKDLLSLRHQVYQVDNCPEYLTYEFEHLFQHAVIYEVEELAAPCDESMERLCCPSKHIRMPFGVVSGVPCVNSSCKVDNAIKFLQEEMNSDAAFTFTTTVKTAVGALQHMFGKKFKATEIEIFVLKSDDGRNPLLRSQTKELPTNPVVKKMKMMYRGEVQKMPIRAEGRVQDYLTLINA